MESVENFQLSLEKAKRTLDAADRMIYTIYPIVKENKLFIKILEELYSSLIDLIKAILQYEYIYKRIKLYTDAETNFETFIECASRYNIPQEEISDIRKVFFLFEKHKQSSMGFVRNDKFVIMSDNLRTESITLDALKHYLNTTRDILHKAEDILTHRSFNY